MRVSRVKKERSCNRSLVFLGRWITKNHSCTTLPRRIVFKRIWNRIAVKYGPICVRRYAVPLCLSLTHRWKFVLTDSWLTYVCCLLNLELELDMVDVYGRYLLVAFFLFFFFPFVTMEGDKLYSLYSWIYRGWQEKLEHVISMGSLGSSHRLVPVDRVTCCTRRELLLVWWLVVRVLSQRGISAASAPLKLDDHCSCLSSLWSSAVLSARRVSGHFYTACIPARGCRWDKRRVRGTIETRGSGENSIMNALRFPSPFFFFFLFCIMNIFLIFIYFIFSMKITIALRRKSNS